MMKEYFFLFALAALATLFAIYEDLKKREVANWLNFSLIAFGLSYRAFFSLRTSNFKFLLLGLLGTFSMYALANILYYSKVFAGGDAKLLMGFGAIIPSTTIVQTFANSVVFVFILFLIGSVYGLFYTLIILKDNKKQFSKKIRKSFDKNNILYFTLIILFVLGILFSLLLPFVIFVSFFSLIPFIYLYARSIESCMIKVYPSNKLTEGDWIENDIKFKNHFVKKTVHGLSLQDIKLLQKYNVSVKVREGIPFTPAFLFALGFMVSFYLVSGPALFSVFF